MVPFDGLRGVLGLQMVPFGGSARGAMIAQEQLYALHKQLDDNSPPELRLQVGALVAYVEIANRLEGIEKSLDVGPE